MTDTIVLKKYANRRLYDTTQSAYVTLDEVAEMVREGKEVRAVDERAPAHGQAHVSLGPVVDPRHHGAVQVHVADVVRRRAQVGIEELPARELEPAPGTKSSRVIGLADDIARSMSAVSVRIAVIPGRNVIGIELPNANRELVSLRYTPESSRKSVGRALPWLASR